MPKQKSYKKAIAIFFIILGIILVFAFIDYLFHLLSEEYAVPSRYFTNKVIYGTLFGLITYYFARKQTLFKKSLYFSLVVSVLLQVRYFLEGYALSFVLLFLGIHFIILLAISWTVFRMMKI